MQKQDKDHSDQLHFDVVIVGGNMVGASLANLLARQAPGLSIALVEPMAIAPLETPLSGMENFEARVSAVSLASENLLKFCGAWNDIVDYRTSPYDTMAVWDDVGTASVCFNSDVVQQPHLGNIVENKTITASLWQQLRKLSTAKQTDSRSAQVRLFERHRLASFQRIGDGWSLGVEPVLVDDSSPKTQSSQTLNMTNISCSLLIAADGANSQIVQQEELAKRSWDYHQTGIVCTVRTQRSHNSCARQSFLSTGPLALLPLRLDAEDQELQHCSVVWSCSNDEAQELLSLDDQAFCSALGEASDFCLGSIIEVSKRFSFPLKQSHAMHYVKEALAVVGDAAHTIHPLAGQGANLGLLDGAVLAEELSRAANAGVPVNSLAVLRRYERRRKGHNLSMMAAMEAFKRTFKDQPRPVVLARNLGMRLFNSAPKLKTQVLHRAMGLAGDLPKAARAGA